MSRLSHWDGKCQVQDQNIGKEETWANLKILKFIFPFIPCWLWAGELEKAEKPEKLEISIGSSKKQEFQKNIYFCFIDYAKAFDCVDHNKLWKILKEMGISDHLACILRNLYAGQEATVRAVRHRTIDWFQIRKGVCQGCILLPCLFNLYAEYIMWNARLDEAQAGIKIAGELPVTSDIQMTPPLWQKVKKS